MGSSTRGNEPPDVMSLRRFGELARILSFLLWAADSAGAEASAASVEPSSVDLEEDAMLFFDLKLIFRWSI